MAQKNFYWYWMQVKDHRFMTVLPPKKIAAVQSASTIYVLPDHQLFCFKHAMNEYVELKENVVLTSSWAAIIGQLFAQTDVLNYINGELRLSYTKEEITDILQQFTTLNYRAEYYDTMKWMSEMLRHYATTSDRSTRECPEDKTDTRSETGQQEAIGQEIAYTNDGMVEDCMTKADIADELDELNVKNENRDACTCALKQCTSDIESDWESGMLQRETNIVIPAINEPTLEVAKTHTGLSKKQHKIYRHTIRAVFRTNLVETVVNSDITLCFEVYGISEEPYMHNVIPRTFIDKLKCGVYASTNSVNKDDYIYAMNGSYTQTQRDTSVSSGIHITGISFTGGAMTLYGGGSENATTNITIDHSNVSSVVTLDERVDELY